jgi:hypothetical protein
VLKILRVLTGRFAQGCEVHELETVAVHKSLEYLCRRDLDDLNLDSTVRDVLGEPAASLRL